MIVQYSYIEDKGLLGCDAAWFGQWLPTYIGERACKSVGSRLKGPWYLSGADNDRKIRARKQRTDFGKYCFVNRTIRLWNQLSAEEPATFPSKSHIFRKRVREVIISEEK